MKIAPKLNILPLLLAITLFCRSAHGQSLDKQTGTSNDKKAYFKINAGYGIGMGGKNLSEMGMQSSVSSANGNYSVNDKSFSFGAGPCIEGVFGYQFNENIGVELGAGFMLGMKVTSTNTYSDPYLGSTTDVLKLRGNVLSLTPSIIFSGKLGPLKPYSKIGIIAGYTKLNEEETYTDAPIGYSGTRVYNAQASFYGNIMLGLRTTLGNSIPISDRIDFVQELTYSLLNYAPAKEKIASMTYDGQDVTGNLTTSQKEVVFTNSMSGNNNQQTDPNQPTRQLQVHFPYSSLSLMVGLRFWF